jgi:hypothetical protein
LIVSRRELLAALAIFALLALAFSWPLPLHLGTELPTSGFSLHPMHLLYGLSWGAHALATNPFNFFQATFCYPYQSSLAFLDHMFALAALAAPFNWATGNMLSGIGAYLLVRYLTDSAPAALLAGILFAFHPFRHHSVGLLNVLAVMWIPFALLTLHLWVETRLRRQLFLFLAFAVAQFLSSTYTAIFLPPAVLLYIVVLLITDRSATLELLSRQRWIIFAAAVMGILAVLPFAGPYLEHARAGIGLERTLPETAPFSALPLDYVTPAPWSGLGRLAPWAASARHPLFFGLVGTVLALAWIARRGWRRHPHRPEMIFYLVLAPLAIAFSFGSGIGEPGSRIPMPFAAAYHVIPGFSLFHDPVRFVVLASLAVAVLAGAGLASLFPPGRASRGRYHLGAFLIAGLAAGELFAGSVELLRPLPGPTPEVYQWLAGAGSSVVILELPMPVDEAHEGEAHARYQLYSLIHGKRIVNGVAAFVPPLTRQFRERMQRFPDSASVAMIRNLGVTYVLVHTDLYAPDELETLRAAVSHHPGLHLREIQGPIWVVDVIPTRAAAEN